MHTDPAAQSLVVVQTGSVLQTKLCVQMLPPSAVWRHEQSPPPLQDGWDVQISPLRVQVTFPLQLHVAWLKDEPVGQVEATQAPPQSVKPALQTMPQVPLTQVAEPCAGVGQTWPHVPQLLTLFATQAPPQGMKPALQTKPQVPLVQVAEPFAGVEQTWPHAPQLAVVCRLVSQPFAARPSQLPKPALQTKPQVPLVQVAVACAGAGQALPQPPQLAVLVCRSAQVVPHSVCVPVARGPHW